MYCENCGNKLEENVSFCPQCGAETNLESNIESDTLAENNTDSLNNSNIKSSSKRKVIITSTLIAVVLCLIAASIFVIKSNNANKEKANYKAEIIEYIDDIEEESQKFIFTSEQKQELLNYVDELNSEFTKDKIDKEKIIQCKEKIDLFLSDLSGSNQTKINETKQQLINTEIDNIFDDESALIEEYSSTVDENLSNGDYHTAMETLNKWQELINSIKSSSDSLAVSVEQYDISELPNVKLYVNVKDANGSFVHGLDTSSFSVSEQRNGSGEFKRQTLHNVAQLNKNEGISIGLVADISGSMSSSLSNITRGIHDFISSVQFSNGDEIELTQFNDSIYVSSGFTSNVQQLNSSINSMVTGGSTRLYDALISEIERVRSCSNAKCVIAFTDGYDNASYYSYQDVINSACEYKIPIFLIGIGEHCDANTLSKIAEQTGGFYENISTSSTLGDIYQKIYTTEKEVYVLEYKVENADDYESPYKLNVYVRENDTSRGNAEGFSFEPQEFFDILYNRFLIAGVDCQFVGERNLLDSGLIITSEEAYKNKACIAYQSQESINTGGAGTSRSDIFMALVDYDVLNIYKDGNGYVLYGYCNYDISKVKSFGSISNEKEKQKIKEIYGNNISDDTKFWIELNITNYEKLTVVKDADGQWKFNTRVYEREGGGNTYVVNQVYNVKKQ